MQINNARVNRNEQDKNNTRKKPPGEFDTTPEKEDMDIESKIIHQVKFHQLPEEVLFYLTDIFPFGNRLFISGVLSSGQTINIVASQPMK
jgi:hypothetical protein